MGLGLGVGEMECKQWEGESISAGSGHQLSLPPQHPYTHPPRRSHSGGGGCSHHRAVLEMVMTLGASSANGEEATLLVTIFSFDFF